jgi:hypothetical protein
MLENLLTGLASTQGGKRLLATINRLVNTDVTVKLRVLIPMSVRERYISRDK